MSIMAAMGIGALIGGLGAKQRGGNFLKGALSGAALGGATGWLGSGKAIAGVGGSGGMFGFGSKMLPNFLAMSGIGMGTEMFGQQEANRNALEARRRIFQEDEDERIARLSRIAGYDVADPKNFMTPQSYFGAEGGMISRPQYQFGGISSLEDDPAEAVDIQELQMDPGTMGPGELVEEFDFMEEAGSDADESGWYEMFFNEFGRPPVDTNELDLFRDQIDISPTDVAQGGQQGPMMAAEGGRVHAKGGIYLGPDDELEDNERYDEELLEILGEEGAMFHGDYDVADEWNKGGRVNARFGGRQFSGLNFGGGFDRSGGERVFQAKTVDPGQKGVYESYRSLMHPLGGGVRLSPGGIDVNKAAQDYKDWRSTGGGFGGKDYGTSQKGENTARHIYNQYNLKNFSEKYPGAAGLGMTAEDVYNQQLLDEEAPEDYKWLAEGGIADLDLRGGGASFGPGTGTSDDIPAMLSDGEFVVTANAVRNLGGGDRMEGARRMYSMMNQLDPQSQSPAEMSGVGYA